MKRILSTILALTLLVSLVPAVFAAEESTAIASGTVIDYVFAHGAHTSSAGNKGTVGTNLTDVGFDDMVSSVSSGAWGNKTYRTSDKDGHRSGALAVHKNGDFINVSFNPATSNFESPDPTATKGFYKFDTKTSGGVLPILIIRIDVPQSGRYTPAITQYKAMPNGQFFKAYLVKETAEVQAMTAAQVRASLSEADAIGTFDSCVANTTFGTHDLEDSAYLLAIVPNGMSPNSDQSKISAEIGLMPTSFKLRYESPIPDELSSLALSADKTYISVNGESAKLSVKGTYTRSGERVIANTDVSFSASPSGVVSISADGTVSPIAAGSAVITATYGGKTATVEVTVTSAQRDLEYVISLKGLNKDKMVIGSDATKTPVLRTINVFYYLDALHWDYEVAAEYSATGEPFMLLDTTEDDGDARLTDKWAFVKSGGYYLNRYLTENYFSQEFSTELYDRNSSNYVAFEVYVDYVGEYKFYGKSDRSTYGAVPAVYFFPKETAGITLGDKTTYPAGSKIGYFDTSASFDYQGVGNVKVNAPGSYYVIFETDSTSLEKNPNTLTEEIVSIPSDQGGHYTQDTAPMKDVIYQKFLLRGIKLAAEEGDVLNAVQLKASNTTLEVGGDAANLSVFANYSASGATAVSPANAEFAASPTGVVSVSADGVVKPLSAGEATVRVTYGGMSDIVKFKVKLPDGYKKEYIFGLSAFNKDKMITGASSAATATATTPYYGSEAVLNPDDGKLYYRPSMNWNYMVPAEFSATGESFPSMNLSATAPWAFEANKVNLGSPRVQSDGYFFEYSRNSYITDNPSFVAFRLRIDEPAKYKISVLSSTRQEDSPITAVYLFEDGTPGVVNNDVSTYPESAKLGYYDLYNAERRYKVVGEIVEIPRAGEYIIAFVGDETSYNKTTVIGADQQRFYLSGIKFEFKGVVNNYLEGISLSATKTDLEIGENATISAQAHYFQTGAEDIKVRDVMFSVAPEGVVSVSSLGVVKALSPGTTTVTATFKANTDVTSTLTFNVKDPESNVEITGDTVSIALSAFVKDKISGDAKKLLTESDIQMGSINRVTVGSTVTLRASETDELKFLYWYNGNSGKMISDKPVYSFVAGTNLPIYAKYAKAGDEFVEYFNAAGEPIAQSEGTFNAEPDATIGSYYKLYKDISGSSVAGEKVTKTSTSDNFVCWTKDGKVVSYDKTYEYYTWGNVGEAVEVTSGEKSTAPEVALFKNGNNYMLELVNCEGVEIIEKGILFSNIGTPMIDSCYAKAVSLGNTKQFVANSEYGNARAYVIYRDGAAIRVAYSK